ncbi:MAG: transaldolase / glucose-6-phosphate isomerase [Thermodesulfobacteriota bacterium]|nr:transaldolase / glucose-6-phosphate isomerase [Thermodesulfobacteriota bacterium]
MKEVFHPGSYRNTIDQALAALQRERIAERIRARDYTVWKPAPAEISNRLGWLESPWSMGERLAEIDDVVEDVRQDGYQRAILLGMGGSSLAAETFRKVFGVRKGYLELAILDSTDPETILSLARNLDLSRTLFIVATKSGGTVETFSFLKYFYNRVPVALGPAEAGRHFIAITDPDSGIADWARRLDFRHTFLNDPNIGGRFSALSCFGLVPGALMGMDVGRLLASARTEGEREKAPVPDKSAAMSAVLLGTALGELAKAGRDKATFFLSPKIESFGAWLEQLLAESTGKDGQGILPIVGEVPGPPEVYGNDRVFINVSIGKDKGRHKLLVALRAAGHPVLELSIGDAYDLGGQIFRWEMATAVAGQRLGINPFDQPDVEAAKILAGQMLAAYRDQGKLPAETPVRSSEGIDIYGDDSSLRDFLARAKAGDYVALQVYAAPTGGLYLALASLRCSIRDSYGLATTAGYGPRYLHSTGQLHKGDRGAGLFIQITTADREDAPIPDDPDRSSSSVTFGVLKAAQAMGDRQALIGSGRWVMRLHIRKDLLGELGRMTFNIKDGLP